VKSIPTRSALILLVSAVAQAQSSLDLEGRYWITQTSARLRVERGGFGTDIDARRDLGIPDTNFPQGAITWTHGRNVLSFTYTPIDLAGDQTVTRTIVFRGVSYTIGTRVQSDLEVRHLELRWAFQFVRLADGRVRFGPMIEADGFLLKGSVSAPALSPPVTAQEDLKVGLPAPGIALDIEPRRWIDIYGRVAGMEIGGYGYYVGSDSGVKVRPWRHVSLAAGYRTFNLRVDNSPDFARLQLRGPFVGAGIRF
jgi:hypothetical protein